MSFGAHGGPTEAFSFELPPRCEFSLVKGRRGPILFGKDYGEPKGESQTKPV